VTYSNYIIGLLHSCYFLLCFYFSFLAMGTAVSSTASSWRAAIQDGTGHVVSVHTGTDEHRKLVYQQLISSDGRHRLEQFQQHQPMEIHHKCRLCMRPERPERDQRERELNLYNKTVAT